MSFKAINRPEGVEELNEKFRRWLWKVTLLLTKTDAYSVSINPASVPANTSNEQLFTVTSVLVGDIITVNKPTHTAGLVIGGSRVSAANQVAITFGNLTGSAIDPPEETYLFKGTRT